MAERPFQFEDAAAYERMMANWSRRVGTVFLDWLALPAGLAWIDIGCGNGAFTELIAERCAPAELRGVDPSETQLAYARSRPAACAATFEGGDAMALPFPPARFDAATMALVIFFVPDPAKAIAEAARVVRPGGTVASYTWDVFGGGMPLEPIWAGIRATGMTPRTPPASEASRMDVLQGLWAAARLKSIAMRAITVERTFNDFDEFWNTTLSGTTLAATIAAMAPGDVERLKRDVRMRLPVDAAGHITYGSRANAIKGRVPA